MPHSLNNKLNCFLAATISFTIGYSTLIFMLPLYLARLGASQTQIGFLRAIYTLPSFLIPILAGKLSDKYGRIPLILTAQIGFTLVIPFFPMTQEIFQVILIRVTQGFFEAMWWVSIEVQIADMATPEYRGTVLGRYNASWATGFLLGPFIAGYLLEQYGYTRTFYFAAIIMISLIPLILFGAQKPLSSPIQGIHDDHTEDITADPSNIPYLLPSWITSGTCGGILGIVFGLYPVYAETLHISVFQIGAILLGYGAARIFAFLIANYFMNRLGNRPVMLGGLIFVMSSVLLGLSTNIIVHILVLGLIGMGLGFSYTAALTISSQAPPSLRGKALGKFEVAFSIGLAGMSQIGGISADWFGLNTPYIICGVFVAIIFLCLLGFYKYTLK
ncbi:MAG: MFS transporter [Candidatus Hodarchaeota archaeon]